jgi:hypothetical protein
MEETKQLPEGHWAREDPAAVSASPHLPAFIARPPGSPAYYGFPLLADSEKDGFIFGIITDVRGDPPPSWGDAYVVAPDGSRAGIEWRMTGADVKVALPPEPGRWGGVRFSFCPPCEIGGRPYKEPPRRTSAPKAVLCRGGVGRRRKRERNIRRLCLTGGWCDRER